MPITIAPVKREVGTATILERTLDGRYRVRWQGRSVMATSQAGLLALGATVTVADTENGPVIISTGQPSATRIKEVIIHG